MIGEVITCSLFGGLALAGHLKTSGAAGNDAERLQKIFALSGLNVTHKGETYTAQLLKKKTFKGFTEYRYRLPLGRSFDDYKAKKDVIESGIKNRMIPITFSDLVSFLKSDKRSVKGLIHLIQTKSRQKREIELSFDGVLIIRIYDEPLPKVIDWTAGTHWKVPVGQTREKNKFIHHDFEKIPHVVLGGATRFGKSNFINSTIASLLTSEPDNVRFHLIDLKGGVELCDYENAKQTVSVAYEPDEALYTLQGAYEQMRAIQSRLRKAGKKNVQEAGIKERHFVIIDEVGELNPSEAVGKEEKQLKEACQTLMSQIARLGAGLGFRLILATQYGTGDVIPRQCKQNADAKLCFRVQSGTASRVVLDEVGAEELPQIKGRAIFQSAEKRLVLQTPLISSNVIRSIVEQHITEKQEEKTHEIEKAGIGSKTRTDSLIIEEI
jgi:DNA segregation ATPase FtsK/SpoIIIE, S-DNA-T family